MLSGYHHFMDRLRTEGKLYFYCECMKPSDVRTGKVKVEPHMPMLMKCFCERTMIVVDEKDLP